MVRPGKPRAASGRGTERFGELSTQLADLGRDFHRRGWTLGTSGNFSAVVRREPFELAITSTGLDKEGLGRDHFLLIDQASRVLRGTGEPSAEAVLHLAVVSARGAGVVLHTHSVWSTILSEAHAQQGGLALEGYEMLKGLRGISTHEHREWIPVLENTQDVASLARTVTRTLELHPCSHGFLIRRHGLYTWGEDVAEAKRHVEILEFLLEVTGRGARSELARGAGA